MKIETTLTMNRAQAQVMTDALDLAADANDADSPSIAAELRAARNTMDVGPGDSGAQYSITISRAALTQVAIGCQMIAEWDEEGDQPTALTDEQRDGLVAMIDALKKGGAQAGRRGCRPWAWDDAAIRRGEAKARKMGSR